ncbi:MAG: TIGR03435 family protein [Vicinamibacterales bacterium]
MTQLPFCLCGVRGGDLAQRIESILAGRRRAKLTRARRAVLMFGAVAFIAAPVVVGALTERPQAGQSSAAQGQRFEVASIKRGDPIVRRFFLGTVPGRFMATNMTARDVIAFAFDMRKEQISGGPAWIDSERFMIEAKPHDGVTIAGSAGMSNLRQMLRSLLQDRFKLAVHRDTRVEPIYELVVASGGFRLTPVEPRSTGPRGIGTVGQGNVTGTAAQMSGLASFLSGVLGRWVVDKTGLPGQYDFTLTYAPEPGQAGSPVAPPEGAAQADPNRPSLFTALQEQLGLRLATNRGPVDIVVIDGVERPVEN